MAKVLDFVELAAWVILAVAVVFLLARGCGGQGQGIVKVAEVPVHHVIDRGQRLTIKERIIRTVIVKPETVIVYPETVKAETIWTEIPKNEGPSGVIYAEVEPGKVNAITYRSIFDTSTGEAKGIVKRYNYSVPEEAKLTLTVGGAKGEDLVLKARRLLRLDFSVGLGPYLDGDALLGEGVVGLYTPLRVSVGYGHFWASGEVSNKGVGFAVGLKKTIWR